MSLEKNLNDWIVDNFEEVATDMFEDISDKYAERNSWDIVEIHFMVEEMVEKVKNGLLNLIKTYDESQDKHELDEFGTNVAGIDPTSMIL